MSKHMQLTVRVRPYYKNGLKGIYPRIARGLDYPNKSEGDEDLSLFDIVGRLDKLLYDLEGNPIFREILLEYHQQLHRLHEEAQGYIADWKLAMADQVLYRMEDIFDEIERKLDVL